MVIHMHPVGTTTIRITDTIMIILRRIMMDSIITMVLRISMAFRLKAMEELRKVTEIILVRLRRATGISLTRLANRRETRDSFSKREKPPNKFRRKKRGKKNPH